MRDFLCVHCWRVTPPLEAFVECPSCDRETQLPEWARSGKERRRARELERSWLQKIGLAGWSDPVCRRHPESRLNFFCECGEVLPPDSPHGGGRPALGFAGAVSSGKTLLTITMLEELSVVAVNGKRIGIIPIGDTDERFEAMAAPFLYRRERPLVTLPPVAEPDGPAASRSALAADPLSHAGRKAAASESFAWRIHSGAKRRGEVAGLLAFFDVAGEVWSLPYDKPHGPFERYLELVGGLVFLIDGRSVAADLGLACEDAWDHAREPIGSRIADRQLFGNLLQRLAGDSAQVDLALAVSKADHIWQDPRWRSLEEGNDDGTQPLLEEMLVTSGRSFLVEGGRTFRSLRLFSVSSLGFVPGPGDVRDGRLIAEPRPRGVTDPVTWLLEKREQL